VQRAFPLALMLMQGDLIIRVLGLLIVTHLEA